MQAHKAYFPALLTLSLFAFGGPDIARSQTISGTAFCNSYATGGEVTFFEPSCVSYNYGGPEEPDDITASSSSLVQVVNESGNASGTSGYSLRLGYGDLGLATGVSATAIGATAATGQVQAELSFFDSLVAGGNSGTLALISYRFELYAPAYSFLTGTQSIDYQTYQSIANQLYVNFQFNGESIGCVRVGFGAQDECSANETGIYTFSGVIEATAGQEISFGANMQSLIYGAASAYSEDPDPVSSAAGYLDAYNSLHLNFESLTPGVSLATASGHDYSFNTVAPIPEPSTYALMISGLLLIGWVTRNRRMR